MTGTLPVGALTPSGWASGSPPEGWLPCDGSAHAMTGDFLDLATVISWNFGGDGQTVFNVPDCRGRFLRGTSHATSHDPDSTTRTPSAPGGLSGDNVGSVQAYATRAATNPFTLSRDGDHTHAITNVPAEDHHVAYGAIGPAAYNIMQWDSGATTTSTAGSHTHTLTGGDAETRPINIYLDWWIAQHDLDGAPPIGSVLAFGGDSTDLTVASDLYAKGWLLCDFQKLNKSDPKFAPLFAVIGTTYGGDSLTFRTPDLRGQFVSGAAAPNQVGAKLTTSTTGVPVAPIKTTADGDHTHTIDNIPPDTHTSDIVAGYDCAAANSNPTATTTGGAHTHVLQGMGDKESRPLNIYVDYIIRYK